MKKKTAAIVVGSAAVLSLGAGVNQGFEAEELLRSAEYLEESGEMDYSIHYAEQGKLSKADRIRAAVIRLPVVVKALFLLPLWVLGAVPVALVTALAGSPLVGTILELLLQGGLLVGLFCGVYKLLCPNKKVRDLFKKKNIKWVLAGSGAAVAGNWVLSQIWDGWTALRVVLFVCVGFGVLCLLWQRLSKKIKAPEAEPVETTLELSYGQ